MKQTYITAIVMFAAGGCLACLTADYTPKQYHIPVSVSAAEVPAASEPETDETRETAPVTEEPSVSETEPAWQPSVDELNLAWFFPEDADQTDPSQSRGGEIFRILMTENGKWMSNIYNYHDISPEQMAARLSLPRSHVLGGYNSNEASHDPSNPDTWTINSFKNVRMHVTNGDGRPISVYSNVIEIMAMANQYTYYKDAEDYDLFLSYAQKLWSASHSYSVSMSDIYYCSGCMDEASAQRELEEMAEQEELEEQAESAGQTASDGQTELAGQTELTGQTELAGQAESEEQESSSEKQLLPDAASYKSSPSISTSSNVIESIYSASKNSSQSEKESAESSSDTSIATPSAFTLSEDTVSDTAGPAQNKCPGHIDLIINMQIKGLSESNGLFAADTIGNDPANMEEEGWPGWTEEMKNQARSLSAQDWYQKYGLSISLITMTNPLTPSEIDSYMADLPADLSDTRRELIRYALSSVGKIPYHWGGKASRPDYNGNNFGTLVPADTEGRILKGLDCSGWINWVYWSVTGRRLPYESTSGLALCGTKIGRNELQPGDIVIRTGEDAHVIMFLGWTEDGRIRCIHESSAGVNNVTVSVRDANWPYYIRILDE